MRQVVTSRWFLTSAFFAVLNIVGLVKIVSLLQPDSRGLVVESFHPRDNAEPEDPCVIRFSQPMVGDPKQPAEDVQRHIRLVPDMACYASWDNPSTLRLRPTMKWPMATAYECTVSREVQSLEGLRLGEDAVFRFRTPGLRLEKVDQVELDASERVALGLVFNASVSPDEFRKHLRLTVDGKELAYRMNSREPQSYIRLVTDPVHGDQLAARIAAGLKCLEGPLGTEEDEVHLITIDRNLTIRGVEANASGSEVWLDVDCTQPVDAQRASDFIKISPEVRFSAGSSYGGFQLRGAFEPARRYRITFLKGLKGSNGTALLEETERDVFTPDLAHSLSFKSQGVYMSARGGLVLPLEAVNIREAKIRIERVYPNNVVYFVRELNGYGAPEGLGKVVYEDKCRFPDKPNTPNTHYLELKKALGEDCQGTYLATADSPEEWGPGDRRLLVITDLGISVRQSAEDVLVWVNSFSEARPVEGAAVSVFSRANQKTLASATDSRGIAHFQEVSWSEERQPFVIVATKGDDTAFIQLERNRLDDSTFDIGGRPYLQDGYEAFLYPDRGIYRPGEAVQLHFILRAPGAETPSPFPVLAEVERPDGRLFQRFSTLPSKWGSGDFSLSLPQDALTGKYSARLKLPHGKEHLGDCSFQVEEFIPDRLKVELSAEDRRFSADDVLAFRVKANHLFGAPAAGLQIDARCTFADQPFTSPAWAGYHFGDSSRAFAPVQEHLGEERLDENGERILTARAPSGLNPSTALVAHVVATVREVGGRAVTAALSRAVDVHPRYVGIKADDGSLVAAGNEVALAGVVVRPDGALMPLGRLEGTLNSVSWNTVTEIGDDGRRRFKSEQQTRELKQFACAAADGTFRVVLPLAGIGDYEVCLSDPEGGSSTSIAVHAGGTGDGSWSREHPDRLELVPDKDVYRPGETANVLLKSPFPGQALVTVESDRILEASVLTMPGNTTRLELPVRDSWHPNVYCSVMVVRRPLETDNWTVYRAFGAVPIRLDNEPRRLKVELGCPGQVRPQRPLKVGLRVSAAPGQSRSAEVTLAAVDEGICQLTRFSAPDPWAFFYGQRRLAVGASDVYFELMPEVERPKVGSDSVPGGDEPGGYDPRLLNPVHVKRIEPVALWKSRIETDETGYAEVALDVPSFTGQLRLMAVACSGQEFGSGESDVRVTQPLQIHSSFPRFLAPADEFVVPVTLFNNAGRDGRALVTLESEPALRWMSDTSAELELTNGREATATFRAHSSDTPGPLTVKVRASFGEESAEETVRIPVRPPATLTCLGGNGKVEAGTTARFTLPGNWVQGTESCRLSFSSFPALNLGNSLRYLIQYPYGCLEQTTSRVFPLICLKEIAPLVDPEAFNGKEVDAYVCSGMNRILSMQTSGGGFGFWPGYRLVYPWGSIQALHCLLEARKAGYSVPQDALDAGLKYLEGFLGDTGREVRDLFVRRSDFLAYPVNGAGNLAATAYACFVLANGGKPSRSWEFRLYEQRDTLPLYSRFHLAGALALSGERDMAERLVAACPVPAMTDDYETGDTLHSSVREAAIMLTVNLDLRPDHPSVPQLVGLIEGAMKADRWATTQENSFALLALAKYANRFKQENPDYRAEVRSAGKRLASLTHKERASLKLGDDEGREIEVSVTGKGRVYYSWSAEGVPASGQVQEHDQNLSVRRRFLSREGQEVHRTRIPQGEVVVVEIALTNEMPIRNIVVSDLLPAGFEIENPRLATTEQLPWLEGPAFEPERIEMRDDRMLVFTSLESPGSHSFRYLVRAVTAGRFVLPPIQASCMYHPGISSVHGSGTVEVAGRD